MAEEKSRYNDMNTILYEMDTASHSLSGYRLNSSTTLFYTPSISPQAKTLFKMNASGP